MALGQSRGQRSLPPDHLLAVELLSLVLWVLLSVPGLALIRAMVAGRSAAARSLLSGLGVGLVCSLLFAAVEQQLLRLLVHRNQIRLATAILPRMPSAPSRWSFSGSRVWQPTGSPRPSRGANYRGSAPVESAQKASGGVIRSPA